MTDYLPCTRRQSVERFEKGGTKTNQETCAHPLARQFSKIVQPDDCGTCALRAEYALRGVYVESPIKPRQFPEPVLAEGGVIQYPQTSVEPPPAHEGYRRRSEDIAKPEAWEFESEFEPCLDRQMANSLKPSGCLQINAFCVSRKSDFYSQRVTLSDCAGCLVRRSGVEVVKQH